MNLNWMKILNSPIFENQSCGNVQKFRITGNYHHILWTDLTHTSTAQPVQKLNLLHPEINGIRK